VNEIRTLDLGDVTPDEEISFDIPANALGFNIVVEGGESLTEEEIGIRTITSPTGEAVHDDFTPKGGTHPTSGMRGPVAAVSVPQSDQAASANPPKAGRWSFVFLRNTSSPPPPPPPPVGDAGANKDGGTIITPTVKPAHASVRIQMAAPSGSFIGGRLDLVVYVPPQLKVGKYTLANAKAAETDEGIKERLDVFYDLYKELFGIERGEVTFVNASRDLTYIDSGEKLIDAFTISKGRPDGTQALHLVFTNMISIGGGQAWGIASGIPGAAARTGTPMSGIVVAVGDTPAIGDGTTIAHEAGHFLGLNHTTEFLEGYSDPLGDTPKCDTLSFENPSDIAACPDRSNMMFPTSYNPNSKAIHASEGQKRVVRGSPVYKSYSAPRAATARVALSSSARSLALLPSRGQDLLAAASMTKSGRALNRTERLLTASLCPATTHGKGPGVLFGSRPSPETLRELTTAAHDEDLPRVLRDQATSALAQLPTH
jgi:hypothetical protein